MIFNPDTSKQAEEVIFSWKTKKNTIFSLIFHNAIVSQTDSKKTPRVTLDSKLTNEEHLLKVF